MVRRPLLLTDLPTTTNLVPGAALEIYSRLALADAQQRYDGVIDDLSV